MADLSAVEISVESDFASYWVAAKRTAPSAIDFDYLAALPIGERQFVAATRQIHLLRMPPPARARSCPVEIAIE